MTKEGQNAASASRIDGTAKTNNGENAPALIDEARNTAVARFLHGHQRTFQGPGARAIRRGSV